MSQEDNNAYARFMGEEVGQTRRQEIEASEAARLARTIPKVERKIHRFAQLKGFAFAKYFCDVRIKHDGRYVKEDIIYVQQFSNHRNGYWVSPNHMILYIIKDLGPVAVPISEIQPLTEAANMLDCLDWWLTHSIRRMRLRAILHL